MKKRLLMLLAVAVLLVGCGKPQETNNPSTDQQTTMESTTTTEPTSTPTETPITPEEPTEPPHEHAYTEAVTTEATCEADGVKTFTCDCGDSYTETIEATGHNFTEYVSNNDATYMADGTETATCVCGLTDTRTAEGSKLELPAEPNMYGMKVEDWIPKVPQYCMEETDVYFEPSFQGPVIGHLSINEEVKVTGNTDNYAALGDDNLEAIGCYPPYTQTESPLDIYWHRIDYNGQTGYIPYMYVWRVKRDMNIELNPLYANYPDVEGNGSGLFYPRVIGKWYYVYGASSGCSKMLAGLNPYCSSMEVYDGIDKNVITTITDTNTRLQLTGNAYATNVGGKVGSYYIYEVYYNGSLAYVDSLTAIYE